MEEDDAEKEAERIIREELELLLGPVDDNPPIEETVSNGKKPVSIKKEVALSSESSSVPSVETPGEKRKSYNLRSSDKTSETSTSTKLIKKNVSSGKKTVSIEKEATLSSKASSVTSTATPGEKKDSYNLPTSGKTSETSSNTKLINDTASTGKKTISIKKEATSPSKTSSVTSIATSEKKKDSDNLPSSDKSSEASKLVDSHLSGLESFYTRAANFQNHIEATKSTIIGTDLVADVRQSGFSNKTAYFFCFVCKVKCSGIMSFVKHAVTEPNRVNDHALNTLRTFYPTIHAIFWSKVKSVWDMQYEGMYYKRKLSNFIDKIASSIDEIVGQRKMAVISEDDMNVLKDSFITKAKKLNHYDSIKQLRVLEEFDIDASEKGVTADKSDPSKVDSLKSSVSDKSSKVPVSSVLPKTEDTRKQSKEAEGSTSVDKISQKTLPLELPISSPGATLSHKNKGTISDGCGDQKEVAAVSKKTPIKFPKEALENSKRTPIKFPEKVLRDSPKSPVKFPKEGLEDSPKSQDIKHTSSASGGAENFSKGHCNKEPLHGLQIGHLPFTISVAEIANVGINFGPVEYIALCRSEKNKTSYAEVVFQDERDGYNMLKLDSKTPCVFRYSRVQLTRRRRIIKHNMSSAYVRCISGRENREFIQGCQVIQLLVDLWRPWNKRRMGTLSSGAFKDYDIAWYNYCGNLIDGKDVQQTVEKLKELISGSERILDVISEVSLKHLPNEDKFVKKEQLNNRQKEFEQPLSPSKILGGTPSFPYSAKTISHPVGQTAPPPDNFVGTRNEGQFMGNVAQPVHSAPLPSGHGNEISAPPGAMGPRLAGPIPSHLDGNFQGPGAMGPLIHNQPPRSNLGPPRPYACAAPVQQFGTPPFPQGTPHGFFGGSPGPHIQPQGSFVPFPQNVPQIRPIIPHEWHQQNHGAVGPFSQTAAQIASLAYGSIPGNNMVLPVAPPNSSPYPAALSPALSMPHNSFLPSMPVDYCESVASPENLYGHSVTVKCEPVKTVASNSSNYTASTQSFDSLITVQTSNEAAGDYEELWSYHTKPTTSQDASSQGSHDSGKSELGKCFAQKEEEVNKENMRATPSPSKNKQSSVSSIPLPGYAPSASNKGSHDSASQSKTKPSIKSVETKSTTVSKIVKKSYSPFKSLAIIGELTDHLGHLGTALLDLLEQANGMDSAGEDSMTLFKESDNLSLLHFVLAKLKKVKTSELDAMEVTFVNSGIEACKNVLKKAEEFFGKTETDSQKTLTSKDIVSGPASGLHDCVEPITKSEPLVASKTQDSTSNGVSTVSGSNEVHKKPLWIKVGSDVSSSGSSSANSPSNKETHNSKKEKNDQNDVEIKLGRQDKDRVGDTENQCQTPAGKSSTSGKPDVDLSQISSNSESMKEDHFARKFSRTSISFSVTSKLEQVGNKQAKEKNVASTSGKITLHTVDTERKSSGGTSEEFTCKEPISNSFKVVHESGLREDTGGPGRTKATDQEKNKALDKAVISFKNIQAGSTGRVRSLHTWNRYEGRDNKSKMSSHSKKEYSFDQQPSDSGVYRFHKKYQDSSRERSPSPDRKKFKSTKEIGEDSSSRKSSIIGKEPLPVFKKYGKSDSKNYSSLSDSHGRKDKLSGSRAYAHKSSHKSSSFEESSHHYSKSGYHHRVKSRSPDHQSRSKSRSRSPSDSGLDLDNLSEDIKEIAKMTMGFAVKDIEYHVTTALNTAGLKFSSRDMDNIIIRIKAEQSSMEKASRRLEVKSNKKDSPSSVSHRYRDKEKGHSKKDSPRHNTPDSGRSRTNTEHIPKVDEPRSSKGSDQKQKEVSDTSDILATIQGLDDEAQNVLSNYLQQLENTVQSYKETLSRKSKH